MSTQMRQHPVYSALSAGLWLGLLSFPGLGRAEDWPDWRGPRGDGTCVEKNVPMRWDVGDALWKTAVPGVGHASPVVWGDRIFTATAMPKQLDRMLLCFDRASGKILWQQVVAYGRLVYFINDLGQVNVIKPGTTFERVAQYELGERCYASPAISDGQVFLRGFEHLFCIGKATK